MYSSLDKVSSKFSCTSSNVFIFTLNPFVSVLFIVTLSPKSKYILFSWFVFIYILSSFVNVFFAVLLPIPNSPFVFSPVCHTYPFASITPECVPSPADIASIFTSSLIVIPVAPVTFAVVPSPICPFALFPSTYTFPSSCCNILVPFPADISYISDAILVAGLAPVADVPHSPYVFVPHEYTIPFTSNAKLCASPHDIFAILDSPFVAKLLLAILNTVPSVVSINAPDMSTIFFGNMIFIGRFEYPSPHAYTVPSLESAILWFLYASIFTMFFNPSIFFGITLFAPTFPFPCCPLVFAPHAYTSPSFVRAKLCEYPTPICVIVSSIFTCAGKALCSPTMVLFPLPNCPDVFIP